MMDSETRITPMMRQYREVKHALPADSVLLFRLGDFYELFFDDAAKVAPVLGITLTKRANIPMCGIPYHALDAYLPKLLAANMRVAIAEQTEDPKNAKGLVKRAVSRIITPGTASDASLIESDMHNYLCALHLRKETFGLASLDLSTGDFVMTELPSLMALESEITRLAPREMLLSESLGRHWEKEPGLAPESLAALTLSPMPDYVFSPEFAEDTLKRHFGVAVLDAFGCPEAPDATVAAGAALYYVTEELRQNGDHIRSLRSVQNNTAMILDPVTLRHLELADPLPGHTRENTLLYHLDQTVTPMGSRLMRDWLLRPLARVNPIRERLESIRSFCEDPVLLAELTEHFGVVRDLERITARLNLGSATPRDFLALHQSLCVLPEIRELLLSVPDAPLVRRLSAGIAPLPDLTGRIGKAIEDQPPANITEGGIIRDGYHEELDALRRASSEGKGWLAEVQVEEQRRTGIKSLKVQYNRVFGYFIEVSKSNLHLVPEHYTRKQTTANGERFITPRLKELESLILGAEDKAKALEQQLFTELRSYAASFTDRLQQTAKAIAGLDVLCALSTLALRQRYICPSVSDETVLDIRGGRHPVLDIMLKDERFVPNDVLLNDTHQRMMIITGPNMAGKSTYIRQTALLTIMAQMGSFIPADSAHLGLADRVFTRIGASDDIARGQSTFMVEMVETANILNHATAKSLVILDEIGRGTSTFDGLAIAWAVAEFLHNDKHVRPRTQFATHYHELTELALICPGIQNFNIAVREYGDQIIFLRQIVPGGADKSYGIHVARLAGLPANVVKRAFKILNNLEQHAISASGTPVPADSPRPKRTPRASSPDQLSLVFEE